MSKEREALFILIDILDRLKDTNDEITIYEISKAIKLLEGNETS